MPYNANLTEYTHKWKMFTFTAMIYPNFTKNSQWEFKDCLSDNCNIVLRLVLSPNDKKVSLNSYINGDWGTSQNITGVDVFPGKIFKLTIITLEAKFLIIIDNKFIDFYLYRLPPKLQGLYISGDLHILDVDTQIFDL